MHSEWNYQLHSKEQGAMPMDQSSPHDDRGGPSMPSNNGPFAFSNMPFAQNMPPFPSMNNVQNIGGDAVGGDAVKTEFVIQNNQANNPPSKAVQAQNGNDGQNGQNGDGMEPIDLPPALPTTMPKI